jgi:hypothetical protein
VSTSPTAIATAPPVVVKVTTPAAEIASEPIETPFFWTSAVHSAAGLVPTLGDATGEIDGQRVRDRDDVIHEDLARADRARGERAVLVEAGGELGERNAPAVAVIGDVAAAVANDAADDMDLDACPIL